MSEIKNSGSTGKPFPGFANDSKNPPPPKVSSRPTPTPPPPKKDSK